MHRLGTRTSSRHNSQHPPGGDPQTRYSADPGLASRSLPASVTFTQPNLIVGAPGDFAGRFPINQPINVRNTALNNGLRLVLSIVTSGGTKTMTVDPGVKAEGPLAGVAIRSP